MVLPYAVHHHPRGERIVWIGEPFGEFQPSTAVGDGRLMLAGEDLKKLLWHHVSTAQWIAAQEHMLLDGSALGHRAGHVRFGRRGLLQFVAGGAKAEQFFARGLRIEVLSRVWQRKGAASR